MASIVNPPKVEQSYDKIPITAKTWEEINIAWRNPYSKNQPDTAKLLRPINYAKIHGLRLHGHIHMNLAELGVPNKHVWITAIKPLAIREVYHLNHLPRSEKPVIGLYIHQTKNIHTYTFIDEKKQVSKIHATPNHRFYVKSLHRFLPITDISSSMVLLGKNNQTVRLLCLKNKSIHCGMPYRKGKITTVYNI